ncbi:MAG: enoyl-CoA hydratase/isomerase family protein [Acidimicrobiales bacterium]
MDFETILYSVDDNVAHIRLNNPDGANAVTPRFSAELRAAMLEAHVDGDVRAVCVTAEGKVFCAGGDLKLFAAEGARVGRVASDMLTDYHGALYRMNAMPKPVVAGVGGAAGGAGMSLVCAFDLVVASENAKFIMAYTKAGVTPDGTSTYFLARHVGVRRAMDLVLNNRMLSAEEAEQWGLINRVVPKGDADGAALAMAQELAAGPGFALGQAKKLVYSGFESTLPEAGEREAEVFLAASMHPDGLEGIAAFASKRAPEFNRR